MLGFSLSSVQLCFFTTLLFSDKKPNECDYTFSAEWYHCNIPGFVPGRRDVPEDTHDPPHNHQTPHTDEYGQRHLQRRRSPAGL